MKSYNIIFYQIYKSLIKTGEKDIPVFSAILVTGTLFYFNILTLFSIAHLYIGIKKIIFDKSEFIYIYFILIGIHYLYFLIRKRYSSIIKELSDENKNQKKIRFIIISAYGFLTLIIFFVFASLG